MRTFTIRFTIRSMMALVAAAAILVFLGQEITRLRLIARVRRQRAAELARTEKEVRAAADAMEACAKNAEVASGRRAYWELHRFAVVDYARAEHCNIIILKYERYSTLPWLSVPPDPPEPIPDLTGPEWVEKERCVWWGQVLTIDFGTGRLSPDWPKFKVKTRRRLAPGQSSKSRLDPDWPKTRPRLAPDWPDPDWPRTENRGGCVFVPLSPPGRGPG
jgi:hypothetical protein